MLERAVLKRIQLGLSKAGAVMFRNNAPDLRDFVEGDVRFPRSLRGGAR